MAITDDELVRQLEAMPLVESPDFRDDVLDRIRGAAAFRPPFGRLKPAAPRLYLGLAWAAAVAIVIGVALFRAPQTSPQKAAATMAPSDLVITQQGDRILVKATVPGAIEWDDTRLVKVGSLPDGSIVLKKVPGATGSAEIRLRVSEREVAKTSVDVGGPTF